MLGELWRVTMNTMLCGITEAARTLGLGRTKIYELINDGSLSIIKIGRRTLIKTDSIRRLIDPEA